MGRSCGFTPIDGSPGDLICSPDVGNLSIAANILRGNNQFCYLCGWSVRREPEIVHAFFPDLGCICMRRKEDAIIGEEGTYSIGVSFEPCSFILLVDLFYCRHVSSGQGTCCRGGNGLAGKKGREKQHSMPIHGASVFVWTGDTEQR